MMTDADPFEQLLRDALAPTYLLVRKLGAGGMGSVYLARDPTLKRNVAVKVLAPELADDPAPRARFQREAEAVAALSHPNVVAVYNVGRLANGVPYFVMQYVNGRSTADRVESDGPFDGPSTKRYLGEVASALAAAHRHGIIHRDIKPANILIDDESDRALVSDFGIAAVMAPDGSATDVPLSATRADIADVVMMRLTMTGSMMGTPAYMSPEQLLAEPVTPKTDVYSLGLLGYEWLTGKGPYELSSPGEVIVAHIRYAPKPLREVRKDVDPEVEAVLRACLAKDPAQRPSAGEAATRLGHGSDVLLEWPPPGLEKLHGQLHLATLSARVGGLLLGIPMAMATALESGNVYRDALPPIALLASIAGIGALLLGFGGVRLLQLTRGAAFAAKVGHGWLTIAEVVADQRRDGGALIVGAREYAILDVAQRSQFRTRRMVAAALGLAAAVGPMLGYFVAIWIGRLTSYGPSAMLLLVIALPVALWFVAANIAARESHMLAEPRERLRRAAPAEAVSRLVDRWRAAFEQARRGQRIGLGFIGRPLALLAVGFVVGAMLVGTTVLAYVVGAAGIASDNKYTRLEADAGGPQDLGYYRAWRLEGQRLAPQRAPVDSTISSLRAGEAVHAMVTYGRQHARAEDFSTNIISGRRSLEEVSKAPSLEREPARRIAGEWRPPVLDSLIQLSRTFRPAALVAPRLASDPQSKAWDWLHVAALNSAAVELTPAQRRALERVALGAPLAEFSVLAHARATDVWGASLKVPIPASARLPSGAYNYLTSRWVGFFANAVIAQAALDLADGQRSLAEARLREVIGAGLAMLEDPSREVARAGHEVSATGRDALAAFFAATGRGATRDALLDSVAFTFRDASRERISVSRRIENADSTLADTTLPPTTRWSAALEGLPFLLCLDLRLLVFPDGGEYARSWSTAKAVLVKDSVHAAIFAHARNSVDQPNFPSPAGTPFGYRPTSIRARVNYAGVKALDIIVGGHRFETCHTRYW